MKLIIAEKPNLATNIVNALYENKFQKRDGYFEGTDIIVSFAYGHLLQLKDIEEYLGITEKTKWTLDVLPFIPEKFEYKLPADDGIVRQFKILSDLINRNDITEIVHCGDSDREGEVIIRNIIKYSLKEKKPIMRLWLPEQTPNAIRSGMHTLKPDSQYDDLAAEGFARTYMDWLLGINLSRYVSIKTGCLLRVGRVLIPIVKVIYDREMEIKNFVPQTYIQPEGTFTKDDISITLSSKMKFLKDNQPAADEYIKKLNNGKTVVSEVTSKVVSARPPKLFSLSKLQGVLGKKYKLSMKTSLSIIQKLYEQGYVTYPRTNTEYLAEGEKETIKKVISAFAEKGYNVVFQDKKSIFDDTKIESHSAITPTYKIPSGLSGDEEKVYETIKNRFLAVFCSEECKVERTDVIITNTGTNEQFKLKGITVIQKGFLQYEVTGKENVLPSFRQGEQIDVMFHSAEKITAPPKRYTIETLCNYLKSPFRTEKTSDDEAYKELFAGVEIGTEATRTQIIENAKSNQYISEKSGVYHLDPKGEYLINSLNTLGINLYKEKTVQLNRLLKDVYRKDKNIDDIVTAAAKELNGIINTGTEHELTQFTNEKEVLGSCPFCEKPVYENKKSFYCSGYKDGCKFTLWKQDKYFESMGKSITKSIAKKFLSGKSAKVKGLKSPKSGKIFDAEITVEFGQPYHKYHMKF